MTNKILAAGSVALMGAGSLLGTTAAGAATVADCGTFDGAEVTLMDGDICDVVWTTPGTYSFKAPTGVTNLQGIFVGAGAGGLGYNDGSITVGYGGDAGEVAFFDDIETSPEWTVHIGDGGEGAYSTAYNTVTGNYGEASDFSLDVPPSDFEYPGAQGYIGPDDDGPYVGLGANTGNPDRNTGFVSSDPDLVGANNALWPVIPGEQEFAVGGIGQSGNSDFFTDLTPGSGGNASQLEGQTGADGMIIVRYYAPKLASTGVDAAPMGIAAAGMLVAGGVGLAIARRARRSK